MPTSVLSALPNFSIFSPTPAPSASLPPPSVPKPLTSTPPPAVSSVVKKIMLETIFAGPSTAFGQKTFAASSLDFSAATKSSIPSSSILLPSPTEIAVAPFALIESSNLSSSPAANSSPLKAPSSSPSTTPTPLLFPWPPKFAISSPNKILPSRSNPVSNPPIRPPTACPPPSGSPRRIDTPPIRWIFNSR